MNTKDCLQEFGKAIGLDLDFDHTGRCTIIIDDEHEICFEEDGLGLIVHTNLMPSESFHMADLRHVLMASYLGSQTGRAAFSINPQSQDLTLWRAIPSLEDGDALTEYVQDFLSQARYWKEELSAHLGQYDEQHDLARSQYTSLTDGTHNVADPKEPEGPQAQDDDLTAFAKGNLMFFRV